VLIAFALLALSVVCLAFTPDVSQSLLPAGWWFAVVLTLAFGISERAVFHFEYRREAISFSLSEVPTIFALVYLSPGAAIAARLVGSAVVLLVSRRQPAYKMLFNLALFTFELAASFMIMRLLMEWWGTDNSWIVLTAILAMIVMSSLGSIVVSIAISRFEGEMIQRITDELRTTWWLYLVNSTLAGMALALALVSPWLAVVAVVPTTAVWYVIYAYGALGQRLRDLDAVHGFTRRVSRSLDLEEITESAVSEAARLLRSDAAAIVVFDAAGRRLLRQVGTLRWTLPESADDPAWAGLFEGEDAQLVRRERLIALGIERDVPLPDMIVAPVSDPSGGAAAVMIVAGRSGAVRRFDDSDVDRMQTLAEQFAVSIEKGVLHQRIEHEARHDVLTGLPNRSAFERQVSDAARRGPTTGVQFVMMLDLDRFKEVNDTLGHHAGDELLVEFAQRITALLRPRDVLSRLAGDEFAILAERTDEDEMFELASSCVSEAGRPVTLDGLEIVVTASVGVTTLTYADIEAAAAMRRADIAMYNAKSHRLGIEVYRDEIDRRTPARLSMLGDLRTAIERDEFDVHYQPKLDLASGVVVGAEALVRWTHVVRGVVAPSDFVRVAEDTGLIKQLTDLMLARGIRSLKRIQDRGHHLGLSVNLSTHDLLDTRLADRVRGHLDANGVDPGMLTLEITESALLIDAPRSRATIDELHELGVRMSIDDFGTGYSSLSYLRHLPVRELKIDQSFVANLLIDEQDEVIVRSTIDLGHNLGLEVVAEGVENNEVLDQLRRFGCDVAQGYCISRPLTADLFIAWLNTTQHPSRHADPLRPEEWTGAAVVELPVRDAI
jgi:diguanylate cyclase (GGDEF)-like protein